MKQTNTPIMTDELREQVLNVISQATTQSRLLWCVKATGEEEGYAVEIYDPDAWRMHNYILSGPYRTATAAMEAKKLFEMGFTCNEIDPLILDIYAEKKLTSTI